MNQLVEKIDGFPLVLSQVVMHTREQKIKDKEVYKMRGEDMHIELTDIKEHTVKRIV